MPDRRLQIFHTVAGVLSFTRAAELLHMTQPAITHQIRQLEQELDTRLFDRTNNRISLTAAGAEVLRHADRILAAYGEMGEAVKAIVGDRTGPVTLGASTTVAEYMLPGLLGDFRQRFPEVRIRLTVANTEAIANMVADNSIDLGVVEGEVDNGHLLVEECMTDELVLIMPPGHPFAVRSSISAEALPGHAFVLREDGSGTRSVIARWLEAHDLGEDALDRAFELGSTEAIKGAVQAGVGVSIVSRATITNELELGKLVARPLEPRLQRPFFFVRQRQKFRSQLMDELYDFAKRYFEAAHAAPPQDDRSR